MPSIYPKDLPAHEEQISNFDNVIPDGVEAALRARTHRVEHPAWDHHGQVWHDGEEFVEEVWCYGSPVAVHRNPDLRALIDAVNDNHGWK